MGSGKSPEARYAIQSWYKLQIDAESLKVNCDEVIKIPLCLPLIDPANKYMVPGIVVTTDFTPSLASIEIVIETSEGFTVEPFKVLSNSHFGWVYILALPPKTTGLKNVNVFAEQGGRRVILQSALSFEIMEPPYNYEGAALENVSLLVQGNEDAISGLESKVEALENKTNSLKLVADTPYYRNVNLPKGSGEQSINIEDGMLYFYAGFFYPSSSGQITHHPKITLFDGSYNEEFVLSIITNPGRVIVDLLAGMIYVATSDTGEIKQQFKTSAPEHGFKRISFDNFDDITNPNLIINIDGRRVV